MPTPSTGEVSVTFRPQPRPRLSLLATDKNEAATVTTDWTIYENLRNLAGSSPTSPPPSTSPCSTTDDQPQTETSASDLSSDPDCPSTPGQQEDETDAGSSHRSSTPIMASTNRYSRDTSPAGANNGSRGPRRCTTLPNNPSHSGIPSLVRRSANTLGGGRPLLGSVTASSPTPINGPRKYSVPTSYIARPLRSQSVVSNGDSGGTTIKCMPYNSPRLAKSTRFVLGNECRDAATVNGRLQSGSNGVGSTAGSTFRKPLVPGSRPLNYRFVAKSKVAATAEVSECASTNGVEMSSNGTVDSGGDLEMRGPFVTTTNVRRRHQQLQLCRLTGRACSVTSSQESLEERPPELPNSLPVSAVGTLRRRTTEYRKSASIPPQLVANLTQQFNSMSSVQGTVVQSRRPSQSSSEMGESNGHCESSPVASLVIKRDGQLGHNVSENPVNPPVISVVATTTTTSSTTTIAIATIVSALPAVQHTAVGIRSPRKLQSPRDTDRSARTILSTGKGTSSSSPPHLRRPRPRGFALASNDRGYVSATDGNESSDAETIDSSTGRREPRDRRLTSSSDCLSSDTSPPEPSRSDQPQLGPVRKAIHSYEVALAKATSSPEFARKWRAGDPAAVASPVAERQVRTLPPSTQMPSHLMSGYHRNDTTVVRTLPHASWAAARDTAASSSPSPSPSPLSPSISFVPNHLKSVEPMAPNKLAHPITTTTTVASAVPGTTFSRLLDSLNEQRAKRQASNSINNGGYAAFASLGSASPSSTPSLPTWSRVQSPSSWSSNATTTTNNIPGSGKSLSRTTNVQPNKNVSLNHHHANRPLPSISDSACSGNGAEESVFHARPALVVNQTAAGSAAILDHDRHNGGAEQSSEQVSRGQALYQQRARFLSSVALANRKSMDLLAEIDDHPSMKAAARWRLGSLDGGFPEDEGEDGADPGAPNASFLWRDSTQTQMQQERPNPFYVSSFPGSESNTSSSGGSSAPSTGERGAAINGFIFPAPPPPLTHQDHQDYKEEEEHMYEELFNCRSRPLPIPEGEMDMVFPPLPLLPPPRADLPLPLPTSERGGGGSSDESGSTEVTTYALNRDAMSEKTNETLHELIPDYESDESWIDDSDDGNDDPSDKNSKNPANLRNKARAKRQSSRKMLMRHSWSRSLRDLVISHDLESETCVADGRWDDGLDSDDSPSHVYNQLDVKLAMENCKLSDEAEEATDSVTPDTDSDKSPTSITADDSAPSAPSAATKSTVKVKKVKRNWSWTKTDFRLDFTSKMRLNKKPSLCVANTITGDNGVGTSLCSAPADLSPTKRRQWIFKSKSSTSGQRKAAGGTAAASKVVSPKRTPSPRKESAQFYIPTRNSDGSLASPPGCMASLDNLLHPLAGSASNSRPVSGESTVKSISRPISTCSTVSTSAATQPASTGNVVAPVSCAPAAAVAGDSLHSGSTSNLSSCSSGTVTSRKARRVSNPGLISRPTTAPPAPPVSAAVLRGTSTGSLDQSSAPADRESVGQVDGVGSSVQSTLRRMNSGSSDAGSSGKRSLNETKRIGGSVTSSVSSMGNHRSSSSVSSVDGDNTSTTLTRRTATRSSITSAHSNSSCESYILPEETETGGGVHRTDMMSRFLESDPTVNEDSSSDTLTSDTMSSARHFLDLGSYFYNYDEKNLKLSPFEDEPLYQFYNKAAQERSAHENQTENGSDDDCYESLYQTAPGDSPSATLSAPAETPSGGGGSGGGGVPSAMDLVKSTQGGARTLWCEVAEVRASGILDTIDPQRRKLQEAMFEVMTSEASYLKSLNILVSHFMLCPAFSDDYSINCVLSRRERHVLFSDVVPVRETSERLLAALESRWQENIVLSDICDILQEHATKYFDVYVKYCSNQIYQDRCLKQLKESNSQFVDILRNLESSSVCQNLSMYSFLMLPMQRITRMPLLVDAIFNRLVHGTKEFETCKQALATINKLVHECNEGALRMERMEEMLVISRQLDFGEFKALALISASRWLVKKGELSLLTFGEGSKIPFGKRCSRLSVYVFLFTDLLIITTKRKSEDSYNVVDHCPRNMVQVQEIARADQLPERAPDGCRHMFQLTMLQNHDNKTVEMYLSCATESDLTRWMEAVPPKRSDNPDERIYEEWDCPQVQAIHCYVSQQPDELALEESDVVNVFRKMADGWYQGERIRDGVQGWFPSTYTVEIVSSHVRARNLRQRYRLLALSYSYMEEQRKKEGKCK